MNPERPLKPVRQLRERVGIGLLLFAGFAVGVLVTRDQPSRETERELSAAQDSMWRAWFVNDTATLGRVLPVAMVGADRRLGSPVGWNDRPGVLAAAREFTHGGGKLVTLRFWNTRSSVISQLAVMTGNFEYVIEERGALSWRSGRTTTVFVREGGKWVAALWYREDLPPCPGPRLMRRSRQCSYRSST